jgi:hypothetical protein
MSADATILLNRLQNVRSTGDGQWRACCPVHESKSRSSLAIRQVEDSRILIYCHGGCSAPEIIKVCGLEMTDLMPERITHNATPEQKRKWREAATLREINETRKEFLSEARVVWVAGSDIRNGRAINDKDMERLEEALSRIETAGRKLRGS